MQKKDFDLIMEEITAELTGEPDHDIPYLKQKAEAYKDSEFAQEIARACGRLIFSALSDDKKEEFDRLFKNHSLGIESVIEEAQFNMYRQKFDVAKKILTAAVEKVENLNMYQDDAVSEYHTFNSPIEELIYRYFHKPEKDLRQAPEPFSELYFNLGCVLFELKNFAEADEALKKAARWNPIDPQISFEHAEIFKQNGDMKEFYKRTLNVFPHAYKSEHVARCYRNLGYYFVEEKLWKVAAGCYLLSTHYTTDKRQAQSELWYIQQKAGKNFSLPTIDEIKKFSEQYEFPFSANEDIIGIALEFGRRTAQDGQIDLAKYFLGIAYDLTKSEEIKKILDGLDDIKSE